MRRLAALLAALALAGCSTPAKKPACPAGEELLSTAQLYLGRIAPDSSIRSMDLGRFIDEEITPRFPDGVTVMEGGVQWAGPENREMREASKVVRIVLPPGGDPGQVEEVRAAYLTRFQETPGLVVAEPACLAF